MQHRSFSRLSAPPLLLGLWLLQLDGLLAFVTKAPSSSVLVLPSSSRKEFHSAKKNIVNFQNVPVVSSLSSSSSTALEAMPTALTGVWSWCSRLWTVPTPMKLLAAAAVVCALTMTQLYKRLLWPGYVADPSLQEPLPPGSMGCPFVGKNFFSGTREYGPNVMFDRMEKRFGEVFRTYAFGVPIVSISGKERVNSLLEHEFEPTGLNTVMVSENFGTVFGDESILYETDKKKHGLLRRLAGSAMTVQGVTKAVPAIQAAANDQVDDILKFKGEEVEMETICNRFTLDVAWRQILGLDLSDEEIPVFHEAVKDWIDGMLNPLFILPFRFPGLKQTKAYKARNYLVELVEQKLEYLDRHGPDGSTLSGIYFARDNDGDTSNDQRKLTRQQVIDNSLILILAGSETSATSLTVAMLALGLHPDVWHKIQKEQDAMQAKYGDTIEKKTLDDECPYLDAVIRETLRLRPLTSMEARQTKTSVVVDGKQIPKNWFVLLNIRGTHNTDPAVFQEDGSHMDMKKGFQPERWLGDAASKPSAWMPFGEGGRRCLGEKLAMTEMKIFLATLARRLDFDLVSDEVLWKKNSIMSRPLNGAKVIARQRDAAVGVAQ